MNTLKTINTHQVSKPLVSVAHAASILGVSSGLIYKLRLSGTPGIIAVGRSVRVDLDVLLRHVRGQRRTGAE
jgi:hypothetical protein